MVKALLRGTVRVYKVIWMIILTVLLGAATWLMAYFYEAEKRYSEFLHDGQHVTVRITETDRKPRQFFDQFGRTAYVRFTYQHQPYEVRCVDDTTWLSAGDRVQLLYHPVLNEFEQPRRELASGSTQVVSRLVNWTVLSTFSREHQILAGLILAGGCLFFYVCGVFASLTGLTILQPIAQAALVLVLAGAALFFTYDSVQQYQYVQQLKTEGQPMEVRITDASREAHGRKSHWYTYKGRFRFRNQDRVIVLEEEDYDRLHNNSGLLQVFYHPAKDDFVPVDYSLGLSLLIGPLFFWFILGLVTKNTFSRSSKS